MNQNLKIPLTNPFILQKLPPKDKRCLPFDRIQPTQNELIRQASDQQVQQPTNNEEWIKTVNTSLNYSTEKLEKSQTEQLSHLNEDQSLHIRTENDQIQLLQSLLTFNESQKEEFQESPKHQCGKDNDQTFPQAQDYVPQFENLNNEDYSNELLTLKAKIIQIEVMAQQEIIRLKQQLNKERVNHKIKVQVIQIGINTDEDPRDEEIKILQESLKRQMALNKELLSKQIVIHQSHIHSKENMQNHINKIMI